MEHKGNGDCEGVVAALVEMASFCDRQLRLKEDDGDYLSMEKLIWLYIYLVECFRYR